MISGMARSSTTGPRRESEKPYWSIQEQVDKLNAVLRGHYAYYDVAGNIRALQNVYRATERYWHRMLCSRSRKGHVPWEAFQQIKACLPLLRPKLYLPDRDLQQFAAL